MPDATSATVLPSPHQHRLHTSIILAVCCVAQLMVVLDVSIVNVALPAIQRGLGFSQTGLQWVVNAYTLTFAGFLLLGGRAGDLLGRRRVFLFGITLFTGASLIGGLAESQGMLIAARALQGIGGAVMAPSSLAILGATFSQGAARNRAFGMWSSMGGAGGAVGVLAGGALTDLFTWPWIFLVNVPIGIALAATVGRFVPETRDESASGRSFDFPGAITVTLGLSAIVYGVVRTGVEGWFAWPTYVAIGIGVVFIACFLINEGKVARDPLVPLRIFRQRDLAVANVSLMLLGAALFAMWFFISLYLQRILGMSPMRAGLAFIPMTISIITSSTLAPRAIARVGLRPVLVGGMLCAAGGLALFARITPHGSYATHVLPAGILVCIGTGASFVSGTVAAMSGVPGKDSGLASGLVNAARLIGGALGLAVLATVAESRTNSVLASHGAHALSHETQLLALTEGYQNAFIAGAALCVVGAGIALLLRPREPGPPGPVTAGDHDLVAEHADASLAGP